MITGKGFDGGVMRAKKAPAYDLIGTAGKNMVNPASRIAGSKSRFTASGFMRNALFVYLPW